ncbi:MAG: translation initiation factor IF-3 [Phycisphaerae bacterium]|nr:translation initiation factor IF-3 [Phycisphaerae bacterium]
MVKPINQNLRCNEQIRISPVRLIGENNEQIGILTNYEALKMAREAGLDLVEVAPNVRPPVCRLINYGRWKYNQKKNIKKHHELQLKEVRLRPKTDPHDREIKVKRAVKFLKQGHKVQFTMVFRGREQAHRDIGYNIFSEIVEEFGERVKVERSPGMEGRRMIMILAPVKGAFDEEETLVEAQAAELETPARL